MKWRNGVACVLLASTAVLAQPAEEQSTTAAPTTEPASVAQTPEVIVVTGHLPGPPLWRVSKGDHVLWIFGLIDAIPVGMEWDSARVEQVMMNAEEIIMQPGRGIHIGKMAALKLLNPISVIRGMSLLKRLARDPDGLPLQKTLPPELYQRFAALKIHYFPKNKDVETMRPLSAMDDMRSAIFWQVGLRSAAPIRDKINALAGNNRKMVRTYTVASIDMTDSYGQLAKRAETLMKTLPRDKELACFTQEVDRMEVDLDAIKHRANAWAKGNVDEYREIHYQVAEENPCTGMMDLSSEGTLIQTLRKQSNEKWVAAAEAALTNRNTSFAMLKIDELLSDTGLLSKLEEKGYDIKEPE